MTLLIGHDENLSGADMPAGMLSGDAPDLPAPLPMDWEFVASVALLDPARMSRRKGSPAAMVACPPAWREAFLCVEASPPG